MTIDADLRGYSDWKGWAADEFGTLTSEENAYFSSELASVWFHGNRPPDILELGFGNGSFAAWARARGARYLGTELNAELLARANAAGYRVYDGRSDEVFRVVGPRSLDLVVAFDVLEHMELPALEGILEVVHTALRPGGKLLARVPSGDSPFGRSTFHGDLTHKLALASSAIRQLAIRHGYEVAAIRPPRMPLRGLGPRRAARRALVLGLQRIASAMINLTFHHNQPLVMTGSLVFELRKPDEGGAG